MHRGLLAATITLAATTLAAADSFTVGCWEFDRGNVAVYTVGMAYADTAPVIVNGGETPNIAEYDLDFPVTAEYAISGHYTAQDPRPVDILLDDVLLVRGFGGVTGSWQISAGVWEEQVRTHITAGRHTVKLICPGACIPHIAALRFETDSSFPAGWRRRVKPLEEVLPRWSGTPAPGVLGYAAYVRADGTVDAPSDYDPIVPYEPIPAPAPRAERILEYLLMGAGRYSMTAAIEVGEDTGKWQARLTVQVSPERIETDVLPLEAARIGRMLAHSRRLLQRFGELRPEALAPEVRQIDELRAKLQALPSEPQDETTARRLYELYVRAYQLKHRTALSNPLLDFARLLFVHRQTYDTSHIYTTYFDGSHRFGGGLATLSPVRPDGQVTAIPTGLPDPAIYRDPDLSWDGQRVLFSYKPDGPTPCRIYEVGLDGSGLRQLTNSEYDDIDPCYLPDGRIMFVSTRCRRVVLCHNAFTVSVLHIMNADGGDVRCVSANTVNDFTPSVLPDGRVAYTKWEYVDKQLGNNQSLWTVNPDGSNPRHIAGEHWGPITFWEPRAIPGSNLLITTLAPHMPIAVGPIALVAPEDVCSSPARFEHITREIPPPRHFGWHRPHMGYYCNPYPLSEDFYLVAHNYGPDDRDPRGYGLYLLDRWNNRDLIYRDPDISCFEAIPVRPQVRPPAIPDVATGAGDTGTLCVLNIYDGLTGVEPGSVKYLRVVEEIPKPVAADCSGPWLQYPVISQAGHLALKRVLGTVPVAADGSAYFRAPANRGLYFSALDDRYMEVQRMRALTEVRAGQTLSCVGCHESRTTAPPLQRGLAFQREASTIEPPPGGPKAPDFARDVQPILNRHCLSCHDGPKPAGELSLSPAKTNLFNVAYENLTQRGYVSYVIANDSSTLPLRPPKYYGSHASRLIAALLTTHRDRVGLSAGEWRELVEWADLNAPYYGTYTYSRPGTLGGRELLTPGIRRDLQAVYQRRCVSCHQGDTGRVERVNFEAVERSPALLAPLATTAGGTGRCGGVFAGREDADWVALVAALQRLRQEMAENPRADMLPARPPLMDDSPRYVYRP